MSEHALTKRASWPVLDVQVTGPDGCGWYVAASQNILPLAEHTRKGRILSYTREEIRACSLFGSIPSD